MAETYKDGSGRLRVVTLSRAAASVYDDRVLCVARLLERLAAKDVALAEHSEATGALAARIAVSMGLRPEHVRDASLIGLLHEVGTLIVPREALARMTFASEAEILRIQRAERKGAVALVKAQPEIADLADAVGSVFDDVVPRLTARIVVVADTFDYLVRSWPHRPGVPGREALTILERNAGVRYDPMVVASLCSIMQPKRRPAIEGLGA